VVGIRGVLVKEEDWIRGTVTDRIEWTEGLVTLRFDVVPPPFRPGQFTSVGVEGQDKEGRPARIHRLYSIASAPGEPLEFFLVRVDGGKVSPHLEALGIGEAAWIHRKPKGKFTLDRVPESPHLWLFASGTGVAPYLSMLRTEEPWERFERIVTVQGVRFPADVAYEEELRRLSARHDGRLSLVTCVTRMDPGPKRYHGRITAALQTGKLSEMAGVSLTPETSQIMICGNPRMIEELLELLHERGFRDNTRKEAGHLTYERYW
jgi:ferredoxin--NADP+ reductase